MDTDNEKYMIVTLKKGFEVVPKEVKKFLFDSGHWEV